MAKQRRNFTAEFKREAARLANESGKSMQRVADDPGIPRNTLNRWRAEFADSSTEALRGNGKRTAEQERIWQLERECGRLMREHGIIGAMPKRRRVRTTDSRREHPIAGNVLNRNFSADHTNQKWVSDITYIWTDKGWLYLASVLDLFSRRIIGWSMSDRIDQDLTLSAINMALQGRQPARGLLHHSDRGSQYCATAYRQMLADWQIMSSMSRKANCWDNAVIESWHRTLKVELVYREQYRSRSEARRRIFEYIEIFYNRQRRPDHGLIRRVKKYPTNSASLLKKPAILFSVGLFVYHASF